MVSEMVLIKANEATRFIYRNWPHPRMLIQIKCDACAGRSGAKVLEPLAPGIYELNEHCLFCGRPLLAEVIFV